MHLNKTVPEDGLAAAFEFHTSCVQLVTVGPVCSAPPLHMVSLLRARPPHLTCRVYGTGSGWRTGAAARLCCQAPASTAACSGALLLQSPLIDTPGAPAQPTLGRKAYVLSVLEHQHSPRRGGNNMLEVMEEMRQTNEEKKMNEKLMLFRRNNGKPF